VGSDLVPIGRVGRPHGIDGSFFVEGPSERADAFAAGATVYVDGAPIKIVGSKRGSQGRPVIRRWKYLVLSANNEDDASALVEAIGQEIPAMASVHTLAVPFIYFDDSKPAT